MNSPSLTDNEDETVALLQRRFFEQQQQQQRERENSTPLSASQNTQNQPNSITNYGANDNSNNNNNNINNNDSQSISSYSSLETLKYTPLMAERIVKFSRTRFWWFCALGMVAIVVLHLSFLPRTSLSRDYRRWHGLSITKSDIKRNFVLYSGIGGVDSEGMTNEESIRGLLEKFSVINESSDTNEVSGDNIELVRYVEQKFREFGTRPEMKSVEISSEFRRPVSSALRLVDDNGDLVYEALLSECSWCKTPAYFGFGVSGDVVAEFVYGNEGKSGDYDELSEEGVDIGGKIVIIRSNLDTVALIGDKVQEAQARGAVGVVHYVEFGEKNVNNQLKTAIIRETVAQNTFGEVESFTTPKIPCLPVSIKAIEPILNTLGGKRSQFPKEKVENRFKLHLMTEFSQKKSPSTLTNVVGTIDGIIRDSYIIIGAGRDSLTASNPLSNQVIMLEIMRHFHRLVELGWKPLRTIKFMSFDGSKNGLMGLKMMVDDKAFKNDIMCYVNIESECVRGGKFGVDVNPMLEHVVKKVSRMVMVGGGEGEDDIEEDNDEDGDNTLFHYWKNQNNNTVNNDLGNDIRNTDALVFQLHKSTPIVNVKFEQDSTTNRTIFTPNSEHYSYKWLQKSHIDDDWVFHGLLIRFLGLFAITMAEHEVVDYRTYDYFSFIQREMDQLLVTKNDTLSLWRDKRVEKYVTKTSILSDINQETVTFHTLVHEFRKLVYELPLLAKMFDQYNAGVQDGLIQDYPWYTSYHKLKIWAQFKVTNYKLLHMEKEMSSKSDEENDIMGGGGGWFRHVLYGVGDASDGTGNGHRAMFWGLRKAIEEEDLERVVKIMAVMYEKLKVVSKRM